MKVLILFDDEKQRTAICDAVAAIVPSARIAAFCKTTEAMVYYQKHPIDVAFVDYAAKGIGSIPFCMGLKEQWNRVNIIVCLNNKNVPPGILNKLRCSGILVKPPRIEQVREELENLRYPVKEAPKSGGR